MEIAIREVGYFSGKASVIRKVFFSDGRFFGRQGIFLKLFCLKFSSHYCVTNFNKRWFFGKTFPFVSLVVEKIKLIQKKRRIEHELNKRRKFITEVKCRLVMNDTLTESLTLSFNQNSIFILYSKSIDKEKLLWIWQGILIAIFYSHSHSHSYSDVLSIKLIMMNSNIFIFLFFLIFTFIMLFIFYVLYFLHYC